ncbi:MAG TPA: hypothetical protein VF997_01445, partial [Polyangia bacterium]
TAEAFQLATTSKDAVGALVHIYEQLGDWNAFIRNAERTCEASHRGEGVVALRLALASIYSDRLSRPDLAAAQLQAARTLAPNDAALTQRLAQLQLASGQADRAVGEFRRALTSDPFNPTALRGLAEAVRTRLPELSAMFGAIAELGEGRVVAMQTPPRRSPVSGAELQLLGIANPVLAHVAELLRQFEPFAPSMIADVMGQLARGEPAPSNHPTFVRCAAVAHTFGLPPFKLYLDPEGVGVSFVADEGVALSVGARVANAGARVAFEAARLFAFVVEHQTLAAVTDANQLVAILSSLLPSVRSPELEKVKNRVGRVLPRKTRKELERLVAESGVVQAAPAYHADVHRRADRAALLVTGDPVTAMSSLAGAADIHAVRRSPRCHDLMAWLLSDEAWSVLATFARSSPAHAPAQPRR